LLREGSDRGRLAALAQIGAQCGVALIASGDVHMHVPVRAGDIAGCPDRDSA